MANSIVVDGVTYVPAVSTGEIKICVLERGFVYVGRVSIDSGEITITNARALIQWGTTGHLGELVRGPLENTKLGNAANVTARLPQLIHTIEVHQDDWDNHVG